MVVETKRIGLLGGSFDPVHITHIALADAAHQSLSLDQVQLIPAGNPWQRTPLKADTNHRIAMLKLAIRDRTWLTVNDIEVERGGKTYTIDTLRDLPQSNQYYWIMGSDQLENFCTWQAWQEIADRVVLVVAHRPNHEVIVPSPLQKHLDKLHKHIVRLPFSPSSTSASSIRQQLGRHLASEITVLDPLVRDYIMLHKLYQSASTNSCTN